MRAAHPDATVTLWAEDEHRLGLLPVTRRVWAPRGTRPTASVRRRYAWCYVYGFVRPTTGQNWWCLLPTVNTEAMNRALAAFAHDEGINATRRAVLVWDNAGWHTSGDLVLPDGVDLVFLPPASPELQPAERLWPLINEAVANRAFPELDGFEETVVARCRTIRAGPATIRAQTCFHWWPSDIAPVQVQQ